MYKILRMSIPYFYLPYIFQVASDVRTKYFLCRELICLQDLTTVFSTKADGGSASAWNAVSHLHYLFHP